MMITTDSPRLTVTPGEWYASDVQIRRYLRQTDGIPAVVDCNAVEPNDLIFRRLSFPPEDVSAGRDGNYGSPKIDSTAVDYGTGDYTWRDLCIGPSVCNRPVTGSHGFGSSQRLGRRCLWLAALPVCWIGSAEAGSSSCPFGLQSIS